MEEIFNKFCSISKVKMDVDKGGLFYGMSYDGFRPASVKELDLFRKQYPELINEIDFFGCKDTKVRTSNFSLIECEFRNEPIKEMIFKLYYYLPPNGKAFFLFMLVIDIPTEAMIKILS